MGDMIVLWQYLFRCSTNFWVVPRDTIYDSWMFFWVLLGGSAFRQMRDFRNLDAFGLKQFLCHSSLFWIPPWCCILIASFSAGGQRISWIKMVTLITWLGVFCHYQVSDRFPFLISKCFVRGHFELIQVSCPFLNFQLIHLLIYIIMVSLLMGHNLLLSFILMLNCPIFGQWQIQAGFYVLLITPLFFEHFLAFFGGRVWMVLKSFFLSLS